MKHPLKVGPTKNGPAITYDSGAVNFIGDQTPAIAFLFFAADSCDAGEDLAFDGFEKSAATG